MNAMLIIQRSMLSSFKVRCYQCSIAVAEAFMAQSSPDITAPGAAVTVRGLAPELKARLRIRAAHNARSMEAEARAILEAALNAPEEDATDLAAFARSLFAPLGGVELELPPRDPVREPPSLGEQGTAEGQPPAAEPAIPEPVPEEPVETRVRAGGAKVSGRQAAAPAGSGRRRR